MLKVVKSTKSTQTSDTAKTSKAKEVLLNILPKRLLGDVREGIIFFKDMNPSLPFKTSRKLKRNIEIQQFNANAYVKKERDLVREYIETRNDAPILWNQKTTEKLHEDITNEDGSVEKKLVGGKFIVQSTPKGMILVDEDGEQYFPQQDEQMKYLQKDIAKEEEYTEKMTELQNTPIEVRIVLFSEDELETLNVPSDPTFVDVFVDGIIND